MAKNNKRCLSKFITATMVMISLTATENAYAKDISSHIKNSHNEINTLANVHKYNEQAIYNKIYDSITKLENEADVSQYIEDINTDVKKASKVFYKVLDDNSDFFYVSKKMSYNYGTDGNGNPMLKINITYNGSKDDIKNKKTALDEEVNRIISKYITSNMSNLEKEMAIHDYLVLNTKYDEENFKNNTVPDISHTAYGALINHVAVCDGYSNAFKLLLNKVGISSIIVSSEQMHHAWNIVTLDNHNYQVDVTWDDPTPDREGKIRYKYFNLDDNSIKNDQNPHIWNENEYPKCNDNKYVYLSNMDSIVNKNNTLYYIDTTNQKVFKCNIDGTGKKMITNDNAESFAIVGDYIYYTNFSRNAYIHKIKIDGTNDTLFKNVAAKNLNLKDSKLNYEDYNTGQKSTITLSEIIKNGWKEENASKVYYKDSKKVTGLQIIDGKNYFFNINGEMKTGWQEINNKKYYFDDNTGQAINGEKVIEDKTYLFDNNGMLIKEIVKETIKPKEEHKEVKPSEGKDQKEKDKTQTLDKEKQKETIKPKEELKDVKPSEDKEQKEKDKTQTSDKEKQKETVKPKEKLKEVKPPEGKDKIEKEKTETTGKETQKETIKPKEEHKENKLSESKEKVEKEKIQVSDKEKQKETVKPKEKLKEVKPSEGKDKIEKEKTETTGKETQKETVKLKQAHKDVKPSASKEQKVKVSDKQEKKQNIKSIVENKDTKENIKILVSHIDTDKNLVNRKNTNNIGVNKKIEKNVVSNKNIIEQNNNKDSVEIVDNKENETKENNIIETEKINNENSNKKETSNKENQKQSFFEKIICAIKEILEKIMSIFK